MYKIFVNWISAVCNRKIEMRNTPIYLVVSILFLACIKNTQQNDCYRHIAVNESVNLDLPQFINLRVPGGWVYTNGGFQGLIVHNNGVEFKAFDRLCPRQHIASCSQMVVVDDFRLRCPCDGSEFNILNGVPLTQGVTCFANEYLVENLNGSLLRITNF